MKEVEILVEVLDCSKEEILKQLNSFSFIGQKKTLDIYFFDPKREDLKPQKDGHLGASFRLRQKGNKSFMAYKVDNFDGDGKWIYSDEHEIEVSDFEVASTLIRHLGFEVLVKIENEKYIFLNDTYEIVFEDVKDLGYFLEVERLSVKDSEDIGLVKGEIWGFIQSLGLKISEELNAGKPELMLKKDLERGRDIK